MTKTTPGSSLQVGEFDRNQYSLENSVDMVENTGLNQHKGKAPEILRSLNKY